MIKYNPKIGHHLWMFPSFNANYKFILTKFATEINGHFTTISGHFFAIYIEIFHKTANWLHHNKQYRPLSKLRFFQTLLYSLGILSYTTRKISRHWQKTKQSFLLLMRKMTLILDFSQKRNPVLHVAPMKCTKLSLVDGLTPKV